MSARSRRPTDDDDKTEVYGSGLATFETASSAVPAAPTVVPPARERSEPMRVISMKAATEEADKAERQLPKVQIRSIADATQSKTSVPPLAMGNLAPPRDPKESRSRRRVDNVVWACLAVMLACGVTLAIWFLAT